MERSWREMCSLGFHFLKGVRQAVQPSLVEERNRKSCNENIPNENHSLIESNFPERLLRKRKSSRHLPLPQTTMVLLPRLSCLGTSPLLKRAISSSLPAQSRIRPSSSSSRFPATTPASSTSAPSSSSTSSSLPSPSPSRYTTTISTAHPFSAAPPPAAIGQASFSTAIGGGGEFDAHDLDSEGGSRGAGGIWDILSGPAADRRKALILKAQDNLLNLVNSHTSNSSKPTPKTSEKDLLDDLFLAPSTSSSSSFNRTNTSSTTSLVDPMILPETRSLSPSTLLLSPSSPFLSLPPIDLSSAWFSPSHPSHPVLTRKEPSLAEQHLRIEAATDASSRVLGTLSEETRREEEEALGMELFRAVAMGRLESETDKGFIGEVSGGWIGEEDDGLGDRNVDMISVKRQRKKMMSKHKYKKRRKVRLVSHTLTLLLVLLFSRADLLALLLSSPLLHSNKLLCESVLDDDNLDCLDGGGVDSSSVLHTRRDESTKRCLFFCFSRRLFSLDRRSQQLSKRAF
ncbi:hypothetical protein BDY24DRAFT_77618 [Mrakia frigida]|uniref:aurora kinase A-interacting protein n=1 Tax=Mrakia frigida TaxID=29902 RepID=UPI003FCBFDA6